MFDRKIVAELHSWSDRPDRKPLVLRGARQVGKTTAVDILSQDYDRYLRLNLESPDDAALFERALPFRDLVASIFLSRNMPRAGGKTLIFIDEIQNSPKAVASLRYFAEAASDLHVVAAGSLLESIIDATISFPVGRTSYRFLRPLDFGEFLGATEERESLAAFAQVPAPDYSHTRLLELFHTYVRIGGMPEAVRVWIETRDIVRVNEVFVNLMTAYADDVRKYAKTRTEAVVINHAMTRAPFEAGARIKFQGFGSSDYRSREMGEALRTLEKAMLVKLVYPTVSTRPPAEPDFKKSPRLMFLDTGMMNHLVGLQSLLINVRDLNSVYKGRIIEHVVGQELAAIDCKKADAPLFWVREKKQSNAEIDYLFPIGPYLAPVEVKSGKTGTLRSLMQFIDESACPFAFRLYAGSFTLEKAKTIAGRDFTLVNIPYYHAGALPAYAEACLRGDLSA